MSCYCPFKDAWRCAAAQGLSGVVICGCRCHRGMKVDTPPYEPGQSGTLWVGPLPVPEIDENVSFPFPPSQKNAVSADFEGVADFSGEEKLTELDYLTVDHGEVYNSVMGAIKSTIDSHGPITHQHRSSATKRIVGAFYNLYKTKRFMRKLTDAKQLSKRGRTIYLASPYNHVDDDVREDRFLSACVATACLMSHQIVAYSPIVHNHSIIKHKDFGRHWDFWKKYDSAMLRKSDAVVLLAIPGWKDSVGVTAELQLAESWGIPVFRMVPLQEGFIVVPMEVGDGEEFASAASLRMGKL